MSDAADQQIRNAALDEAAAVVRCMILVEGSPEWDLLPDYARPAVRNRNADLMRIVAAILKLKDK